ncbi:Glutathione import ATP-binding protein GsiA [Castellaniella defragrans]
MSGDPILTVHDLAVQLPEGADRPYAMEHVSFSVQAGEVVCVVGESGSGKSMTANAIMRLLPTHVTIATGQILFEGRDLVKASEAEMRSLRSEGISMIFQEPMTALNPLHTVGDQIAEVFTAHTRLGRDAIRRRVLELMEEVRIPDPAQAIKAYPHELSGGQRQRAMIAMALALSPKVLIADEPTTALDVTTQAQILKLIRQLQQRRGTAVLFITHDFGVVAEIADRVIVMERGQVVEQGTADSVLNQPRHPYTRALISAVPALAAPTPRPLSEEAILTVKDLDKTYAKRGFLGRGGRTVHALSRVSFTLPRGATLGVVGESGSGKSTLARCLLRLIDPDGGSAVLSGKDLARLSAREMRAETRNLQMVFQDPFASLNPRRKAGDLVAQGLIVHGMPRTQALARARELLALVGLDDSAFNRHPHEFSGGQRQRIGLARALALRPKVLVADEPVSALDVSVQAQVLTLLTELREQFGLSMLFVTHDLRVAAQICDLVVVMKDGIIVESGPVGEVFRNPRHDYTQELLRSIPGRHFATGMPPIPPVSAPLS